MLRCHVTFLDSDHTIAGGEGATRPGTIPLLGGGRGLDRCGQFGRFWIIVKNNGFPYVFLGFFSEYVLPWASPTVLPWALGLPKASPLGLPKGTPLVLPKGTTPFDLPKGEIAIAFMKQKRTLVLCFPKGTPFGFSMGTPFDLPKGEVTPLGLPKGIPFDLPKGEVAISFIKKKRKIMILDLPEPPKEYSP